MEQLPPAAARYFEAAIYLPMLLIVLEKDYMLLEKGEFKLKGPYLHLVQKTSELIAMDLKKAKAYLKKHDLSVVRIGRDDLFTEYQFHYVRATVVRRYSNIRLRNQSEKLLKHYLYQTIKTVE
ncbi:hypothetical protein [Lysinibacillus odysseyi]|uniref:Uncharacterized protein n=1 Tax=Lysinibacillus odysseyi 34hs-1 = NBRC 100172 TaxID=1220589 RepID=A0A0A3IGD5_9BACI|nr:hypothetical protein [Lysinibacillus odysseyi]KGR83816.1 hypothetical protein CD32_14025 [Lysinibacillus odysseyi 34hs-1 = NBRC 100172]